jgi:radical SAM/Cys-rich protein
MSAMLKAAQAVMDEFPAFEDGVDTPNKSTNDTLEIMQINIGRRCNLSCKHCHVEAGPNRTEAAEQETLQQCLDVFVAYGFKQMDITGGSPEMNPHFEWFITQAAKLNIDMMIRSNLVILAKEEYAHLPKLYSEVGATVVASVPHYTQKAFEKQRGESSFDTLIGVVHDLNDLGYGKQKSSAKGGEGKKDLELDFVFNPGGAFLPPNQDALEKEYKKYLKDSYDIVFNNLFAITNNPLGRFGNFLYESGNLEGYMARLTGAFNKETLPTMMCRNQISVGYDGVLYDCDFNQAAGQPCKNLSTIADLAHGDYRLLKREIKFGNHCYACCAGAGSSCGGTTA